MWPRILNLALGLCLVAAPFAFGYTGAARTNDVVVGGLVCVNALLAMVLAAHGLRWVNLALGFWLIAAPWPLGFGWTTMGQRLLVGVLLASTALVPSRSRLTPSLARD